MFETLGRSFILAAIEQLQMGIDKIRFEGWCQEALVVYGHNDIPHSYCAAGSIYFSVVSVNQPTFKGLPTHQLAWADTVFEHIPAIFLLHIYLDQTKNLLISAWNDAPDTRKEDVIDVMEQCKKELEEQVGLSYA